MLENSQYGQAKTPQELLSYLLVDLTVAVKSQNLNTKEQQIKAVIDKFVKDNPIKPNTDVSLIELESKMAGLQDCLDNTENQLPTGFFGKGPTVDTSLAKKLRRILVAVEKKLLIMSTINGTKEVLASDIKAIKDEKINLENENAKLKREKEKLETEHNQLILASQMLESSKKFFELLFATNSVVVKNGVNIQQLVLDSGLTTNPLLAYLPNDNAAPVAQAEPWPAKYIFKPVPINSNGKPDPALNGWSKSNPDDYAKNKLDTALSKAMYAMVIDLIEICNSKTASNVSNGPFAASSLTSKDKGIIIGMIYKIFDLSLVSSADYKNKSWQEKWQEIIPNEEIQSADLKQFINDADRYASYDDKLPSKDVVTRYKMIRGMCDRGEFVPKNTQWVEEADSKYQSAAPVI